MGFIRGESRNQMHLYPITLEELVHENNPVRVIDAFINQLTMDELKFLPHQRTPVDLPTTPKTHSSFTYTATLTASVPAAD